MKIVNAAKNASSATLILLTLFALTSCAKVQLPPEGASSRQAAKPMRVSPSANSPAVANMGLFNPDMGYMDPKHFTAHDRWQYPNFSVTRKAYQNGIRNRDSGYAHDAFIASMAYRSGYYKPGRSINTGKGKDMEKSLHYLHLASDLGHPEASFLLFQCYRKNFPSASMWQDIWITTPSMPVGNIRHDRYEDQRCLHSYENWQIYDVTDDFDEFVMGSDSGKAKLYLERTAAQGKDFDANFQYRPNQLAEIDTLQSRLNMLITEYKAMSLRALAKNKIEQAGLRTPFWENSLPSAYDTSFQDCDVVFYNMLAKSEFEEKLSCANNSDRRFCPGMGYEHLRTLLDACRILAPTAQKKHEYFLTRLGYYHPYFDRFRYEGAYHFVNHARAEYLAAGEHQKVTELDALIAYIKNDTAVLSSNWQADSNLASQQRMAQRAEEERRKQAELQQAEKEWEEYQRWSEQIDREVEQAWASKPIGSGAFNAMDDIQQIQDQSMNNLNMILDQQQGAATRTPPAYSTTPSRPMEYQVKQPKDQPEQCDYPEFGVFCSDPNDAACKAKQEENKRQWASLPAHCKRNTNGNKSDANAVTRGK